MAQLSPRSDDGDNNGVKFGPGGVGLNDYYTMGSGAGAAGGAARPPRVAAPDFGPEYRDVGASPRPGQSVGFSNAPHEYRPATEAVPLQTALYMEPKPPGFTPAGEMLSPTYAVLPGQQAPVSSPYSPRSAPRTNIWYCF